jgi:glycosyltransferase involved in cell wall biosynthesis
MTKSGYSILINQPRSSYFVGGAEMVSLEHAKHIADKGNDVTFVTIYPGSINKEYSSQYLKLKTTHSNSINFIEISQQNEAISWYEIDPGENRDRWNVESLYYNRSLFTFLESLDKVYDIMISYYKLDAIIIPRDKIKSNVLYLCGTPQDNNIFMSSFLAMYDKVIAITDQVMDYWQQYTSQIITVVATGVDINRFKPGQRGGERLKILFVGRLIERKGVDVLIEACSLLSDKIKKSISVTIAGAGPKIIELEALVSKIGMKDTVSFIGNTDTPEKLMSMADICVFPSSRGEGLQGVILESMASGSYVIASDTDINRLLIGSDRGALINPSSPTDIAGAITKAVTNNHKRIFASELAAEYVRMNYNWSDIVDDLLEKIK